MKDYPELNSEKYVGYTGILKYQKIGVFCSIKCPGSVILRLIDEAYQWKHSEKTIISGFHSPMEKKVFDIQLEGSSYLIYCPSRDISKLRIKSNWKTALNNNRLLIISPFHTNTSHTSKELSRIRNNYVAELASTILIPYAQPGGMLESQAKEWLSSGYRVTTYKDEYNQKLIEMGAEAV